MSLKTKLHEQFMVLVAGNIDINHSLKHHGQNIIAANRHNDILMLIGTTQFDLIVLDLTVNCAEFIARIKDPLGINNKIPVIAAINPTEGSQREQQYPMVFDDWLTKPITEEQLNKIIALWQTKASAWDYIQIILAKTKNNRRLALTIFEKLFEELPRQINDIKEALKNKQYDEAKEITHKLNGSSSFCGLLEIQQSANTLESCLSNNDYAAANQHFPELQKCALSLTRHQKLIVESLGQMLSP
ncbi:MAG: Hpt domain-containing protein [Methylococcaceae bacterium]